MPSFIGSPNFSAGASVSEEWLVDAYAHCPDARCAGYAQRPSKAILSRTSRSYYANGGDIPGVENSQDHYRAPNEHDVESGLATEIVEPMCQCGKPFEFSELQRRVYDPVSGYSQTFLIDRGPSGSGFDASVRNTETDAEVAALKAQLSKQEQAMQAQSDKLDKLMAALTQETEGE